VTTFPHEEISLHLCDTPASKPKNAGKYAQNQAKNRMVLDQCTKNRHRLVNELHSIDFRKDKSARF